MESYVSDYLWICLAYSQSAPRVYQCQDLSGLELGIQMFKKSAYAQAARTVSYSVSLLVGQRRDAHDSTENNPSLHCQCSTLAGTQLLSAHCSNGWVIDMDKLCIYGKGFVSRIALFTLSLVWLSLLEKEKRSRLGSLLFLYVVSQFQWFKVSFRWIKLVK